MIYSSLVGAIKNRWMVLSAAVLCACLGVWAYTQLRLDAYPDISGVMVGVITEYPGRAAEEVEQEVTVPLERVFASVPHVEIIRSRSIFGLSYVQLSFEPDVDDYWARDVVFQKLGEITLPPEAHPGLGSLSTGYGEIFRYQIVADNNGHQNFDQLDLRTLHDWVIIPRLLRAKGVVEVGNFGGLVKQYSIQLDKNKLSRYEVKLEEVMSAIKDNNLSGGGSILQRGSTSLPIRGLARVKSKKDIEDIYIKDSNGTDVFIKDVGEVAIDHLPQTGIFGKDDTDDSIEGIVRMRRGENPSAVLKNIQEAVRELNELTLPKGVKIVPFYDRSTLIEDTLHTILHNTFLGISLVVLILFFFLGSPRIALIVALTIPGSLLFALVLMKLTGIPISLLSIGAIDFGIIVDGAIIISENILRSLSEKKIKMSQSEVNSVILSASKEVQSPMLFSMFIVIIAYIPLLFLEHIEGLLFRPMAITLCYAMLGALLIAFYLIPVLASFLFKDGAHEKENKLFKSMEVSYEKLLKKALQARGGLVKAVIVVLALTAFLIFPRLGSEFLPYMDEGNFWIRCNFPEGISLRENNYYTSQMRGILRQFPEVAFVTSQVGRSDEGLDPFPTNRTEMMIGLQPRTKWRSHMTKRKLEKEMRDKLRAEFSTTRFNITQPIIDMVIEDANGTSADLAVDLSGPDLSVLRKLAEKATELMKQIKGNTDVSIEQEGPQPQLQIRVNQANLSRYHLSSEKVIEVINTAIGGEPISQMYEGDRRFDIVVKYAPKFISTSQEIGLLPVFNETGAPIPLAQVATIQVVDGQTLIARADAKRRVTVRCDIRDRAQGDFVVEAQRRFKNELHLPPGYSVAWMGMFENLDRATKHFMVLIPMTVGIIFLVLFLAFRSFSKAALVLTVVPFALVGSIIALCLRGMHFSVSAGVGLTSLFGVATMLGVVMISRIEQIKKEEGLELGPSVHKGCAILFRPIIMTAVVAILGLLPASLATGIGSDVQRPIATVVVGGLFSATLLVLFVLPAFYMIMEDARLVLKNKFASRKPQGGKS